MVARKVHVLSIRLSGRLYAALEAAARRGLRPVGQQAIVLLAETLVQSGDLAQADMEDALLRAARSDRGKPRTKVPPPRSRSRAAKARSGRKS